ncbi:hypothetical protein C8F01DRAFT_1165740 [Mycena amicta]|nr:hypothetical protein C8F01DRAFT_1165740 [Mycena amicta]
MVSQLGLPSQYARTDLHSLEGVRGSSDMAIPAPPTATTPIPQNHRSHKRTDARVPVNIWTPVCPPRPNRLPIPLPPQLDGVDTVSMNPTLRAGGAASGVDFEALPAEILHMHKDEERTSSWSEPATFPGLPSLTLLAPGLPWVVVAHASRGEVSVGDVFRALYGSLSMPVDVGELEVGVGERLQRQGGKGRGKRMAFLEGRTRFAGLCSYESQEGCDTWVVELPR